ncbi:hypothetical protein B9T31_03455 [Acinetobacter sp. ANC 4558]|uniref:fimbrial protein n=1 Tax=Acinetobacter sp. ANC 4558 TaxID=1977876 RepID=UPI000A340D58|nr:fimbrial protein [Acinetobacter sp. ANC 4558]OTG87570.1 hypothetical protein B9T31_03455 [Acinetobacter sp. ANC 4558]
MKNKHILKSFSGILVVLGLCSSVYANEMGGTVNGIAGNIGQLYVHGSLTESACSIAMESLDQSINLGNIETARLQQIGDRAEPKTFQIKLEDCISENTDITDDQTGLNTWSNSQPGMKIRFLAESDVLNPNVIHVNGAKGLGLEVNDLNGKAINIDQFSRPKLLNIGQNILTYSITPVRTASLEPNAFHAIISFELVYE